LGRNKSLRTFWLFCPGFTPGQAKENPIDEGVNLKKLLDWIVKKDRMVQSDVQMLCLALLE